MAEYKKSTKAELAKQFAKEVASGSFSSKKGAAARAADVMSKRKNSPGGADFDTNTYRDRQNTDRYN